MIPLQKNAATKKKPLLLVCPLDWGLGHTTRTIPVISCLLELGCGVIVACNSGQKVLLEPEFPGLRFVSIDGYGIRYASRRTTTLGKLLLTIPRILTKIKEEQMWFLRFFGENRIDAVISDNRYGFAGNGIPAVFITHQLQVHSGFGKVADRLVKRFIYKKINAFTECWVPDNESADNLSGSLAHPTKLPDIPVHYMGCLSRFEKCDTGTSSKIILIILSGPEPQRTMLENIILHDLHGGDHQDLILVRGKPESDEMIPEIKGTTIYNHAGSKLLNELICAADLIISRAGYTTIMDVIKLKKRLLVVPTPGQGEQEYLAKHLSENNIAATLRQKEFSINKAITKSGTFNYHVPDFEMNQYRKVIENFVAGIS